MKRHDYILIANALRASEPCQEHTDRWLQWLIDVKTLAVQLAADSPGFDQMLFERNCKGRQAHDQR